MLRFPPGFLITFRHGTARLPGFLSSRRTPLMSKAVRWCAARALAYLFSRDTASILYAWHYRYSALIGALFLRREAYTACRQSGRLMMSSFALRTIIISHCRWREIRCKMPPPLMQFISTLRHFSLLPSRYRQMTAWCDLMRVLISHHSLSPPAMH